TSFVPDVGSKVPSTVQLTWALAATSELLCNVARHVVLSPGNRNRGMLVRIVYGRRTKMKPVCAPVPCADAATATSRNWPLYSGTFMFTVARPLASVFT